MGERGETEVIGRDVCIRYREPAEACRPYDGRYPEVARRVAEPFGRRMVEARVESVGSAAVPGGASKGMVDLMFPYPPGRLTAARQAVEGLGFQRRTGREPFPDERPVYVNAFTWDGGSFRLPLHAISESSAEAAEQTRIRERLCADPALAAAHVAPEREVLATGVRAGTHDNHGNAALVQSVFGGIRCEGDR
jgi:GrpB-like predicted nucleotidyltransferase (UPF0157 family)